MATLTESQKKKFAAINAKWGLAAHEYTHDTAAVKANLLLSSNEASDVPPRILMVNNINLLKHLAGTPSPDGFDDSHIDYPPPLGYRARRMFYHRSGHDEGLSPELLTDTKKAFKAYVYGVPAKVAEYEEFINMKFFPMPIAVFSGEVLQIPAGGTLTIAGSYPVKLNYEQIIIEPGGKIVKETDTDISAQIVEGGDGDVLSRFNFSGG
jgi:hypothetical protein